MRVKVCFYFTLMFLMIIPLFTAGCATTHNAEMTIAVQTETELLIKYHQQNLGILEAQQLDYAVAVQTCIDQELYFRIQLLSTTDDIKKKDALDLITAAQLATQQSRDRLAIISAKIDKAQDTMRQALAIQSAIQSYFARSDVKPADVSALLQQLKDVLKGGE